MILEQVNTENRKMYARQRAMEPVLPEIENDLANHRFRLVPNGARQTMQEYCSKGERCGSHQPNQILSIFATISESIQR